METPGLHLHSPLLASKAVLSYVLVGALAPREGSGRNWEFKHVPQVPESTAAVQSRWHRALRDPAT